MGISHGYQKIQGIIRIGNDKEHGGFGIADGVQFKLILGNDVPNLLNIKGREAGSAGDENGFQGLA